jgi:C_GCAxxG_C_C family probable redox protein
VRSSQSFEKRHFSSSFAPDFGLDQDTARRISHGFGAGIACTDKMCESFSAAIMVIGLRFGGIRADDVAAKKTYAVVGEFLNEFKVHYGSVACTDLLGHNLLDPQQ